jgi:hypothetical protein
MKQGLLPIPPRAPRSSDNYESPSGIQVRYVKDWVKQHPLEDDGLCAQLYQYLYKNIKGREHSMSTVLLPDTVIFDHNFPRAWYAYDMKNKEIIKRPGSMLDAQTMYDKFAETVGGCDIVAQFFHTTVNAAEEWKAVLTPKQRKTNQYADQGLTYVEFLTAESLHRFLFDQKRKPDGVLQKFVLPKGEGSSRHNFQLQVIWTPYITTVYRRTNRCRLTDHVMSLSERAATFDGAPYLSEETLVADETKHQVTTLCESIADHIYATEKKRLSRLILHVKSDDQNRMWVLWSSCVRVAPDAMNPTRLRVPMCLNMRTELLNDGGSSLMRLQTRRNRQRQLLALDAELFDISRDFEFALTLKASHQRQATALGLHAYEDQPMPTRWQGGQQVPVSTDHPLYPSFLALEVGGPTAAAGFSSSKREALLKASSTSATSNINCERTEEATADAEQPVDPVQQVQDELVALAMDTWYAMYSTMLAEDPRMMPTAQIELAAPLVNSLSAGELQGLVEVLGLLPVRTDETSQVDATHPPSRYFVAPYLVTSGRRLDRPSAEVEVDVVSYLKDVFSRRGDAIARRCMEKFSSYFS